MNTNFYAISTNGVKVGVHDVPDSLITELHDKDIHVKYYNNNDDINDKIKDDKLTGFLHVHREHQLLRH